VLRDAWFIAREDLRTMLRRREILLWVFVMPPIFFYFIGTVTGSFGLPGGEGQEPDTLALVAPASGGFLVDEIGHRLEQENFAVRRLESGRSAGAAGAEDDHTADRVLTLPEPSPGFESFTSSVLAGNQATLLFESRAEGVGTDYDNIRVMRATYGVVADLAVLTDSEVEPSPEAFRELADMPRSLSVRVMPAGARLEPPVGFAQAVPGTMVMFTMIVLLTSGAIFLLIERQEGLLRRLASTPISRGSVVLGKWASRITLGMVQIGFGMIAGSLLFGMEWGAIGSVLIVLFAWAAFNASFGILLANLTGSVAQMAGLGMIVTMVLAALGGCWWPIEITPGWMQILALTLPSGWAMDAMHRLVNFGYGGLSAWPHVAALMAGAVLLGWMGARAFRYQ
jgi:hypothetical protein